MPMLTTLAAVGSTWVLMVSALVGLTARQEPRVDQIKIVGEYRCDGRTAVVVEGKPKHVDYTLQLQIMARGDAFDLTWSNERGPSQVGYGFAHDGYLVAVMANVVGPGVGVVSYKIARDGLHGLWSSGTGDIDRETCRTRGTRAA